MKNAVVAFLLVTMLSQGCHSSLTSSTAPENGQTGSIGAAECLEDSSCENAYRETLAHLQTPLHGHRRVQAASCEPINQAGSESASGFACVCALEGGGSLHIGPAGAPCTVQSRDGYSCLLNPASFAGCSPGDPTTCEAACAGLERLLGQDAARTFDVGIRAAACVKQSCQVVYRVGNDCFANVFPGEAYNCELSDGAILAAATAARDARNRPTLATSLSPPRFHPRPSDEWQGMLVDLDAQPPCEESGDCGLARACLNERCGPCTRDEQCAPGELCALDHCVRQDLATCRTRRDCAAGILCILSGYSADPRANEQMRAYCLNPEGGASMVM